MSMARCAAALAMTTGEGRRGGCGRMEVLRQATLGQLDIVSLDLGPPDLDGTAALRMIRSVSSVPVIIVTARRGETYVVQLLDAGTDDYVVRPFSTDRLAARMRSLLHGTSGPSGQEHRIVVAGQLRTNLLESGASFHEQHLASLEANSICSSTSPNDPTGS